MPYRGVGRLPAAAVTRIRANGVAYVALFVALGGTGYAAATLPRNSVGAAQIRRGAIGADEIQTGAVGSAEIKDGSVTARDLGPGVAAAGPAGPAGPAGAPGARGLQGEQGIRGPAGPTDGAAADALGPSTHVDFTLDPNVVTTTQAGRLAVTKTISNLLVQCNGGGFGDVFLTIDGVRVAGASIHYLKNGTTYGQVVVGGVTPDVKPAGDHTAAVGIDCPLTADGASPNTFDPGGATAVVLGGS